MARRAYKLELKDVITVQSALRRRLARKELKALRAEARSVSKFKEISYKLENKVIELTQNLQARTQEKKELGNRLAELEQQLNSWMTKHDEADTKAKQLQADLQAHYVPSTKFDELSDHKQSVETKLSDSAKRVQEQEEMIAKLTEDLAKQNQRLEERQKQAPVVNGAPARSGDDVSVIALKNELATLREQLNRAHSLNALTKNVREPASPSYAYANRTDAPTNGVEPPPAAGKRHLRRHSSAGAYAVDSVQSIGQGLPTERGRENNRHVSVAFTGPDGVPSISGRGHHANGLGLESIYDDPVEDKIRLLEDSTHLDEDVLQGLIRGLKIPQPHANNTPSLKEVLFPANLISLITNEMWKYGLIPESERFLANVMQSIQTHVMVSPVAFSFDNLSLMLTPTLSPLLEKTLSRQGFSGFQTSTRSFHSFALPRATCFKALAPLRTSRAGSSRGRTTNIWLASSSGILTA